MKSQNKLILLSTLMAAAGLIGCSSDSNSASCGLTEESCQSANKILDANNCKCVEDPDNPDGSLCPAGKHVFDNGCEEDSLQNCGQHGYDCSSAVQGWSAGACLNSACETTACTDGYHTFNHICEADSPQNCGTHDNTCSTAIPGWESGTCTNGLCVATKCAEGQHVFDNSCEEDSIEHCGSHDNNCATAISGWKSGTCTTGLCVATECAEGQHVFDNSCEEDSIEHCGSHENDCTQTQAGWATGTCQNAACQTLTCSENMHLEAGICKADDAEHCGAAQINCPQTVAGWNTGNCTEGKCQPATCADGYHLSADKCVLDTNTCCGSDCTSCDNSNKVCALGTCVTNCEAPQMPCGDTCVDTTNNIEHCGACDNDCSKNKPEHADTMNCYNSQCTVATCEAGYQLKDGQCVSCDTIEGWAVCQGVCVQIDSDNSNCGACGKSCDSDLFCGNGKCLGNALCGDKTYNTATSLDACGECGNRCPDGKTCVNGACVTGDGNAYCNEEVVRIGTIDRCSACDDKCADGLICKDNACVAGAGQTYCSDIPINTLTDVSNCGTCGKRCEDGKVCTEGGCVAGQGNVYCSDTLVDTLSDSANCHDCNNKCAKGDACSSGSCQPYSLSPSSTLVCAGKTVYPYDDSANCGECGNSCGTNSCLGGSCGYGKDDIITFGHYEQDNDSTNGKEPVTWRILDKNASGQYLIISEKTLDVKPYNTTKISITWEKSTIRSWLNGYDASYNTVGTDFSSDNFIDTAFTTEEKAKIISVNVPAHKNPNYSASPGNETTDKIFLLSITEDQNYFKSDKDRKADATHYVVSKGAFVLDSSSGKLTNNGTCKDAHCTSHWWLRTPGFDASSAMLIYRDGTISNNGSFVDEEKVAVRPALWVNL